MFSRYYQSELTYLRELGREFAETNPSLAGSFADREGDPDVERLLEGFAFLSARIRERTEDAIPEIIDALGELVIPQLIRPIPACSIVQFSPNSSAIRGHYRVDEGIELATRAIHGSQCVFRTAAALDLLPLRVERCSMDPSVESQPKIRLRLRKEGEIRWPEDGTLRLFLDGPLGLASTVLLWFAEHLASVELHSGSTTHRLPTKVSLPALGPEIKLLPWPENVPDGLRVAQEYFTLPQKLLFLDVEGLGAVPAEAIGDSFDLVFQFSSPPKLPERLTEDLFHLHCVPVVNVFEVDGNPVINDTSTDEHMLRASNWDPNHIEVYSVKSVSGSKRGESRSRRYDPFFAFSHPKDAPQEQRYYKVRRAISPLDQATDTYLSILGPADVVPDLVQEVLSFELSCTNRDLPTELRPGDICKPTSSSPTVATFRNIHPVTRPTRPPTGQERHWRLISHLGINTRALADASALQSLLAHYNGHEETDQQLYDANRLRIHAIRAVTASHERRVIHRIPMFGLGTEVELDETAFAGEGDAYLFGSALQRLLVSETPINSFHRLTITLHPSKKTFSWKPETGTQSLL